MRAWIKSARWVWPFWAIGLAMALASCGFYLVTCILPLDTAGDPVFDTAMLRSRWFLGYGFVLMQLAVFVLGGLILSQKRSLPLALAIWATAICLFLMLGEEGRIIAFGDLIGPRPEAELRLAFSRAGTLALSFAALYAWWRVDFGQT